MILEGVVTNVAAFGAFVDIGVHQDGLVHISAMSETFVKDPRDVAKPGDIVKVKVLEVDKARKRVALSMRMSDEPGKSQAPRGAEQRTRTQERVLQAAKPGSDRGGSGGGGGGGGNAFADALRKAQESRPRR